MVNLKLIWKRMKFDFRQNFEGPFIPIYFPLYIFPFTFSSVLSLISINILSPLQVCISSPKITQFQTNITYELVFLLNKRQDYLFGQAITWLVTYEQIRTVLDGQNTNFSR